MSQGLRVGGCGLAALHRACMAQQCKERQVLLSVGIQIDLKDFSSFSYSLLTSQIHFAHLFCHAKIRFQVF